MTVHISLTDPAPEHRMLLSTLSTHISKSKRSIIVTGAGISCNAGIPDFRSQDGLYNLVKAKYPKSVVKGKDLFDVSLFTSPVTTSIFFTFIASLRQSILGARPTSTHKFIRTMHERGKLVRCYTQNIDGIEADEGLAIGGKAGQVCQLHGDIHTLRCDYCNGIQEYTLEWTEMLLEGEAPECPQCSVKCSMREARGKRPLKIGTLLPNIVLYNDPIPHPSTDDTTSVISSDLGRRPDLLLIFGTSLKVFGIKKLVKDFAKTVHAKKGSVIFINKAPLPTSEWKGVIDYWVEGDCDDWVHDLKTRIPNLWMKQEIFPSMPVIKPTPKKRISPPNEYKELTVVASKKSAMTVKEEVEDKENVVPGTPRSKGMGAAGQNTFRTTGGLPSPLSPSKKAINVDALESPTKRLRISSQRSDVMAVPPPKMNLAFVIN